MNESREQWASLALSQFSWNCTLDDALPSIDTDDIEHAVTIGYGPGGTRQPLPIHVANAKDSTANRREIFLAPTIEDAETAVCWLMHAAATLSAAHPSAAISDLGFNENGPSEYTRELAQQVLNQVGDWPHAPMIDKHKKQSTRMQKVECMVCGWHFRTSTKQINAMQSLDCLACNTRDSLETV
jgi:hypothetical protein